MQPTSDNSSLLIDVPFKSIKNMTKRAYPLTNPPDFTLPLTFLWIIFNALMYLLRTILTARDYSLIKFDSIQRDVRIKTFAQVAYLPL